MQIKKKVFRGGLLAVSLCVSVGLAQANLLANGSFESVDTGSGPGAGPNVFLPGSAGFMTLSPGASNIQGWSVYTNSADIRSTVSWLPAVLGLSASRGALFVDLTGSNDTSTSGMRQSVATQVGATYHLDVDFGAANAPSCPGLDCSGPMQLSFFLGDTLTASTDIYDPTGPGMQWKTVGFDFTASATTTLLGIHGATVLGGSRQFIGIDNAVLTQTSAPVLSVPEPESWALMVSGMALIAWRRQRARHCQ